MPITDDQAIATLRTALLDDTPSDPPTAVDARLAWSTSRRRRSAPLAGLAVAAVALVIAAVAVAEPSHRTPRAAQMVVSATPTPSAFMQEPQQPVVGNVVHTGETLTVPTAPNLSIPDDPHPRTAERLFWFTRHQDVLMLWAGWQQADGKLMGVEAQSTDDSLTQPGLHALTVSLPQVESYLNPGGTIGYVVGASVDHVTYDDGGSTHAATLYDSTAAPGVHIVWAPVQTKLGNVFRAYDAAGTEHFHYLSEGYDVPSYVHSDPSATVPPTAATVTFTGDGLSFEHPATWKFSAQGSEASSFSIDLVSLSNDPLVDPCTRTQRAGGGIEVSCGEPLKHLSADGVLVTWTSNGFPGHKAATPNQTFHGHPAHLTSGPADAGCTTLGGVTSIDVTFERGASDWVEMRACLATNDQSYGVQRMLDTVDFPKG